VLRGIFGPKRIEVAGSWRRLHNNEFRKLCASPNTARLINRDEMGRHAERMICIKNFGR